MRLDTNTHVWQDIPAPRSEHSDQSRYTSRSGSLWGGVAFFDSSVHGTTTRHRSDSYTERTRRIQNGGHGGIDVEALAGIAAVDIALARGEISRIVARQPARRYIKDDDVEHNEKLASVTAKNPYRDAIVNALGHLAKDAGGIAWIEVWARDDEDSDELHLQTSWLNRGGRMVAKPELARALRQPAMPCAPGVRLPGTLFAEASGSESKLTSPVDWRPLEELASNPDVQQDEHVKRLEEALPWASVAGVVTRDASVMLLMVTMPPERGDVYAPPPPCAGMKTAAPMLRAGAEAVAGMLWMGRARFAHVAGRRLRAKRAWSALRKLARTRMLRNRVIVTQCTFAAGLLEGPKRDEKRQSRASFASDDSWIAKTDPRFHDNIQLTDAERSSWSERLKERSKRMGSYLHKVLNKCKGAGGKPMPRDSDEKTAYTFVYIFITLMVFSSLNRFVVMPGTDDQYTLLLGSMGALCTLMFSAPASPLTQPRNVLFSHMSAGFIGAVVNSCTVENHETGGLPRWVAQAFAPAFTIAVNGRMGITHPPAGAMAIIAVMDPTMIALGFRGIYLPVFVMAVLSIVLATVLNNSNSKRQYPMFW